MNVSLTPELEALIHERVRLAQLRTQVAAGLDALDQGQVHDGDAVIDEILDASPAANRGEACRGSSSPRRSSTRRAPWPISMRSPAVGGGWPV